MDRRFLKHGSRRRSGGSLCRSRKFLRVAVEPLEDRTMLDGANPVFDAAADFSTAINPNGVWSYGYTSTLGSPLILYTNHWTWSGVDAWGTNLDGFSSTPSTAHNGTGSTIVANTITFKPDQLVIHPGLGNSRDVVRFTAPGLNTYSIAAAFFGVDRAPTTTDVHVLHNGVSLFDGNINTFNPDSGLTFSRTVTLSTGDTLDFVVGFGSNGGYFSDSTGLQARITPVPTTAGDLAVRSVELPGRAIVGELTTVGYTVQNVSNSAINGDWTDALYLSQDGLLDSSDVLIGRVQHSGSLAVGETYRGTLTVPMPGVPQGTYSVIAVTDVWGQVADPVRADNRLVSPNPLSVDVRVDAEPLLLNQQEVGRIETPYGQDRWTFSAQAGQQVRFDLINTSGAGTVFDLVGPGGWVGFSGIAADSGLITLPSAGSYTLTAHGLGSQYGGTYAFRLQETQQTDLSLGVPYHGTLVGSDQAQLFRVNLPASHPLQVVLDDTATGDHNELYVKFGSPPTRGDYDYRFSTSAAADQQILVPMAAVGTWYILAYADYVPTPSDFTLLATASDVILKTVTPDHSGSSADAVLTLTGAGFDATSTVALVAAGGAVFPASAVEVDSFTLITATFAAGSIPAGTYTVRVSRPGGDSDELPNAFRMIAGGQTKLETNLVVPSAVGYHQLATIYVEYTNTGDVAMPAPLLILTASQNGQQRALMTLDHSRLSQGFWTSAIPEGFSNSIQILASGETPGVLQPGESMRVPVYYAGWQQPWDFSYPPIKFNLNALTADDNTPADWSSFRDAMRPETIGAEAWQPIWANFTSQVGTTWGGYVAMLDDNAAYLGRLGERVIDIDDLLAFEIQQAEGLSPVRALASSVDAAVDSPGMPLSFSRVFSEPIAQRYQIGRFGRGWSDNWDMSLSKAADGSVTILGLAGSRYVFQPDSRDGHYFTQSGENGTLTALPGGAYTLRETDGMTYGFRADGKLDYVQDPHNIRITCGYTGDLLTNLTDSAGQSLTIEYNAAGRIVSITDSLNRQTTFTYDAANEHLISVRNYIGQVTTYTYSIDEGIAKAHALKEIAYPGGTHQYFAYDAEGHLAGTSRDGGADPIDYSYDTAGKVTATDAGGHATSFYFDDRGLLVKAEDPLGNSVHMSFDSNYNLIGLTDSAGRSTAYTYDDRGNLIRTVDADGHVMQFTYTTAFNELATLTDANGNVTRYDYEPDGDLASITYADGSRESWTYDPLGDAVGWTNRRAQPVAYTYDSFGRVTSRTYPDGIVTTFSSDDHGNLIKATDAAGTTTIDYDANDRMAKITYPNGRFLAYTYDAGGRRTQMVDQLGHQTNYHYDAAGRLQSLTDETGAQIILYTYDAAGRLSREDKGNGTYTTYEYDSAGNVLHLINHPSDGSINSRFDYTYDSRGRRVSMATTDGNWTYEYDDLGQLTHATFKSSATSSLPAQDLQYSYDAAGNRTQTIINGVTTAYTANALNEYTQVGNTAYTYDADGNLLSKSAGDQTWMYGHDTSNRLVHVAGSNGTWDYHYDALGHLASVDINGQQTAYLVDPAGLGDTVAQYDANGSLKAQYAYGLGLVNRIDATGQLGWYAYDDLGSTSEVTDAAGTVMNRYAYGPYGTILSESVTTSNPFGFVGRFGVMDESNGLAFMRSRFYEPSTGRFISRDPIGALGDVNLYAYTHNSPVQYLDPSGLWSWSAFWSALWNRSAAGENVKQKDWQPGITDLNLSGEVEGGSGSKGPYVDTRDDAGTGNSSVLCGSGSGVLCGSVQMNVDRSRKGLVTGEAVGISGGGGGFFPAGRRGRPGGGGGLFPGRPVPSGNRPAPGPGLGGSGATSATTGSRDPNDKIGLAGFGSSGFISGDGLWPYTIRFENDPKATAPAQQVTVTDNLDSNLDWSTFCLTEIGFGDQRIAIPAGSQHFETVVPMTYNGQTFDVQIVAGINPATGQISASFWSIDPSTSLPPDVLTGFLPPENGTGRGQGFVSYTVRPKANLPTGTQIRNIALVNFDGLETIATNQIDPHDPSKGTDPHKEALNTFDVGAPTSRVEPLPATMPTSFTVNLSGTDDTNGSGIASFDLYVSENGGPFTLAQAGIPAQAGSGGTFTGTTTFTGTIDHTYGFYSVATDNVGHVQTTPTAAQTTTTVQAQTQQPTSLAVVAGAGTYGGMTTLTATLTAGGSPLASKTVTFTLNGASFPNNTATTDSNGVATISNVSLSGLNAGTYTNYVGAHFAGDSTYLASSGSSNLTVNQATPTVSVTAPDTTYDGTAHGATVSSVTGVSGANLGAASSFTYYVGAGIGGTSLGGIPPTNVGTYTVVAHYAGSTNYTTADSAAATFQITARPITVTADPKTKVYGTADPTLTYSLTSGNLVGSDSFSGSLSRASGKNVGPYAIGQGTLTAGTNYNLTYVGNNLTITARPITVTADPKTREYGTPDPTLTFTVGGFGLATGDTQATVFTGGLTRDVGETVTGGPYTIRQGNLAANNNYSITFNTGQLTITPASTTAGVSATSVQYSDVSTFTVTLKPASIFSTAPAASVQFQLSSDGTNWTNVGSSQFLVASNGVLTATISPKITVPAGSYTVKAVFGEVNPNFAVSNPTTTLIVTTEDAFVANSGDSYVLTAGPTITTAPVRLAAQVTQAADGSLGDITKAVVTFNLFNGSVSTTPDKTVTAPVDSTGYALAVVNLPVDSWTVSTIVTNGYYKSRAEVSTVDVVLGSTERRTTGGGWIPENRSGNTKANFGYTVSYGSNNSPKGQSVFVIQGSSTFGNPAYAYVVKSNSWQGGGLSFSNTTDASFSGKAVIQVIDRSTGLVNTTLTQGNCTFTVDVTDGDLATPKTTDKYGIRVLDQNGVLWYSTTVSGSYSKVALGGGQVKVQNVKNLLSAGPEVTGSAAPPLTQGSLAPIVEEAKVRWLATGLNSSQQAALNSLTFKVEDLPGNTLGAEDGGMVALDFNAAGYGWFVDPTPGDDSEFDPGVHGPTRGHVDLLSVVAHEMGHELGFGDDDGNDVMNRYLVAGVRHVPASLHHAAGAAEEGQSSVIDSLLSPRPVNARSSPSIGATSTPVPLLATPSISSKRTVVPEDQPRWPTDQPAVRLGDIGGAPALSERPWEATPLDRFDRALADLQDRPQNGSLLGELAMDQLQLRHRPSAGFSVTLFPRQP